MLCRSPRQQRNFLGNVQVLGRHLTDWGREYFEEIGVGFELPNHYMKFTAIENLKFFASLYAKKSRDPMGYRFSFLAFIVLSLLSSDKTRSKTPNKIQKSLYGISFALKRAERNLRVKNEYASLGQASALPWHLN